MIDATQPRPTRILVGVDGSDESDAAVAHAIAVARRAGASLVLAHVLPLPGDLIEDSSYDPLFRSATAAGELGAMHRDQASEMLTSVAEQCRELGVESEVLLVEDNPSDGLARAASTVAADLLVVGTHGRTGLKRLLLGSVAERTVRLAQVSSLVARGSIDPTGGHRRVLIATDLSDTAATILGAALAIAPADALIEVVHCWQTPALPAGLPAEPVVRELVRDAEMNLERLAERYPEARNRLLFVPMEGSAPERVNARAVETGCDLIVTGSHGRRGVRAWLLGSVAEEIVRHAPCSVLVVRTPSESSAEQAA